MLPVSAPAAPRPLLLLSALLWVVALLALGITDLVLGARLDAPESLDAWAGAAGAGLVGWLLWLIRQL